MATLLLALVPLEANAVTISYTSPGTTSWTVPGGVSNITVTVVGAGGGGGGSWFNGDGAGGAGGGSGGAYVNYPLSVTPGQQYTIVVGQGGVGGIHTSYSTCDSNGCGPGPGSAGQSSSFGSLTATGGGGGTYGGANYWGGGGAGGTPQPSNAQCQTSGFVGVDTFPCSSGTPSEWYQCDTPRAGGYNTTGYGTGGTGDANGCYGSGNPGANGVVLITYTYTDSCPTAAWQPWSNGVYVIGPGDTEKVSGAQTFCVTNSSGNWIVIPGGGSYDPSGQLSTFRTYAGNVGATTY